MILIRITITAITRSMWIKPPSVKEVTIPRSQRIIRITAIIVNINNLIILIKDL